MRIKTFSDGSILEYDTGKFDDWCIYLTRPKSRRVAPKDSEYFQRFQQLASKYTSQKIYADFVSIYKLTTSSLDEKVLEFITKLSNYYKSDELEVDILFTIVYAGMVDEENKAKAVLKKRIKRLGMHQVLIEKINPAIAANFSRGKNWKELDRECKARKF